MTENNLTDATQEVFVSVEDGVYLQFDMTLPLQMLFDDVMTFVTKIDS